MYPGNRHKFLIAILTLATLVGCVGNPAPAVQAPPPSPTPVTIQANKRPTPTSAVFKLKPTFTPLPTDTPTIFDLTDLKSGYGPTNFPAGVKTPISEQ